MFEIHLVMAHDGDSHPVVCYEIRELNGVKQGDSVFGKGVLVTDIP